MPRRFGRPESERGCPKRSGLGSDNSSTGGVGVDVGVGGSPAATTSLPASVPAGEHQLVTDARNRWNVAVLRCSDAIVGALYGSSGSGGGGVATKDTAKEGVETRDS